MGIRLRPLSPVLVAGLAAAGLTGAAASPAFATPGVEAGAVDEVTVDGAVLRGTVIPGAADDDGEARYSFEYGSTTAYGIGTATQALGGDAGPTGVTAAITGLGSGTTWHYRLVARDATGTTYGPDGTFTTATQPTAPLVVPQFASAVSATSATVAARVDPANQATSVVFEYGPTAALGQQTAAVAVPAGATFSTVESALGGLSPNTTYFARAIATNPTGASVGETVPFTTSAAVAKVTAVGESRTLTWGTASEISGVVTGAGVEGTTVTLVRQDFPFSGPPVRVATTTVGTAGAYGFPVGPLPATAKFWVQAGAAPTVSSPVVAMFAKLKVRLEPEESSRSAVTFKGTVEPYVAGARATLQRRAGSGKWKTVSRPTLKRDGTKNVADFTAKVSRTSGTMKYRVLVDPRSGGAHYATASNVVGVTKRG